MHANFIEDPEERLKMFGRPIYQDTVGDRFCSIFIEVSYMTFITRQFREWLEVLWTRLDPEAKGIAISIKPNGDNLN